MIATLREVRWFLIIVLISIFLMIRKVELLFIRNLIFFYNGTVIFCKLKSMVLKTGTNTKGHFTEKESNQLPDGLGLMKLECGSPRSIIACLSRYFFWWSLRPSQ